MTHISEYAQQVRRASGLFRSAMPEHQRLVYAVETVVAGVIPCPAVSVTEARSFIHDVCMEMDLDVPDVVVSRIRGGFTACASHDNHAIVLSSQSTNRLILCHELAHLICMKGEGHHEEWRTTFVSLARRFISVEHGALLHALYNRCDLPTSWA